MTITARSRDAILDDIRRRAAGGEAGRLWSVHLAADDTPQLVLELQEGTKHVDELFLRHIAALSLEMGMPRLVLAVWRPAGRPERVDRRLWRQMAERLSDTPTRLADLLVVGTDTVWSAAGSARAPAKRSKGQRRPATTGTKSATPRSPASTSKITQ